MISANTLKRAGAALARLGLAVARDGSNRELGLGTELTEEELVLLVGVLVDIDESLAARNYRGPKK